MNARSIAVRYPALVVIVMAASLIVAGGVETWVAHRERLAAVETLQREQARFAAAAVSRFVDDVFRSLAWVTTSSLSTAAEDLDARRLEMYRLLRLDPSITTIAVVDGDGRERLRVSRIERDRVGSGIDVSDDAGFQAARAGRRHVSEVRFIAQTEPYVRVAVAAGKDNGRVLLADVNLKFVSTVVTGIRTGNSGHAYVVDARGRLVSHADLGLVLALTDLSTLPQVRLANASERLDTGFTDVALGPDGVPTLAAFATIAPLGWTVFVEQPRSEAFAPLVAAALRSALVLAVALVLAAVAGTVAARRMVRPIDELARGATRLASGDLSHRIRIETGDELQSLAAQFNAMGARLQALYDDLELRVAQRTRALELADQAKSRFLAVASHDLRQPLHALALLVGQLHATRSAAERKALTARIDLGVRDLGELLDQLLDLSRFESGSVDVSDNDFAIADVMAAIDREFAPLAAAKGLAFRARTCARWVRSDPLLVRRILANLVTNAIRYTDRGRVLVACRARGDRLRIEVWDTGRGIPVERQADVFHEFVQLRDDASGNDPSLGRGLGLGLAIVARVADLLGTRITLRSRVGHGSVFAFELPLAAARTAPGANETFATTPGGLNVVIVDDDAEAAAGIASLLEGWGCEAFTAPDVSSAATKIAAARRLPDVAIVDAATTQRGMVLVSRLRAAVDTPLRAIVVTVDADDGRGGYGISDVHVLRKPASPMKLRALLAPRLAAAS